MNSTLDQMFLGIVAFAAGLIAWVNTAGGMPIIADLPPMEVARTISQNVDLLRDNFLFTVVILGSLAGAAMSYMVFPPKTPREMAFKFLSCGFSGIVFSPLIATVSGRYFSMDMTGMWVLAVSASVAFLSWSTLQLADAIFQRVVLWWARKQFGPNGPLDDPPYDRSRAAKQEERQNTTRDP